MKTSSPLRGMVVATAVVLLPSGAMSQASSNSEVSETDRSPQPASPDPSPLEDGGRLDLVCGGSGTANKTTVITGNSNTTYTGSGGFVSGSSNATVYGTRQQGFGDQVALFIQGGEGRIRMPRAMLPALRGGEDGWFKLGNLEIKPNEITATVRVNFMNKPKLRIDRYTGAISISGKAGDYSGRCQHFVPEEAKRQF